MYSAFLIRRYKNGRRNKTANQRVYLRTLSASSALLILVSPSTILSIRSPRAVSIDRFEYEVDNGEQWLTAVERSRQIVGNYIRITLLLPNVLQREYNITAIRIIDVNGNVIGQSMWLKCKASIAVPCCTTKPASSTKWSTHVCFW